jgi:hypothetical protein
MTGPRFDFTINLGHVISISAVIVTMVVGWVSFDQRLKAVEKTLDTATATLVEQVRQGARIDGLAERIVRLERLADGGRQ